MDNYTPVDERRIAQWMQETLGNIPSVSSPQDRMSVALDGDVITMSYVFSRYADEGGDAKTTIFAAQYDPEHGQLIDDFDLTIADAYRGKGLGRRIVLEGLEELVRKSGMPLRGSTPPHAHAFWQKLGYEVVEHGDYYGLRKTAADGTTIAVLGEPYGDALAPEIETMSKEEILALLTDREAKA